MIARSRGPLSGLLLLAWLAIAPPAQAREQPEAPVAMALAISLDPQSRQLAGTARLTIQESGETELVLAAGLATTGVSIDGRPLARAAQRGGTLQRWRVPAGPPGRALSLAWRGTVAPVDREQQHRDTLGAAIAAASPEGSFLPAAAFWYPRLVQNGHPLLHSWTLTLTLPAGQKGLVPGTLADEQDSRDGYRARFDFPWPGEGIDLMAGPYRIDERSLRSSDGRMLRLRTVFAPALGPLAKDYLDSVAGYIARYEAAIGPYPFEGFSVVSSPTPTGFGMPTLTYLGESVLRLPFIRHSSLGHEVLHNWWGNGVYPDYASGNWSEGLTTFMADYAYAQDSGADKAAEMRSGWLRDLSAIPPGSAMPLREFTSRHHGASQAVGYGNAAMLFVMLRERIGRQSFEQGLRDFWQQWRFRSAGWKDLQHAFEQASGEDLGVFFEQWLRWPSAPQLRLESAGKQGSDLQVRLGQDRPAYQLDVPLRIITAQGAKDVTVRVDQPTQTLTLPGQGDATRVVLDPDARLLRRLVRGEAPPILREVLFDPRAELLVLGDQRFGTQARQLADRLLDHRPSPRLARRPPGGAAVLVIGPDTEIDQWLIRHALPVRPPEASAGADVAMWTFRLASGKPVAVIAARDTAALEAAVRPLPHYGKQSWLVIERGTVSRKGIWPVRAQAVDVEPLDR